MATKPLIEIRTVSVRMNGEYDHDKTLQDVCNTYAFQGFALVSALIIAGSTIWSPHFQLFFQRITSKP